VAALLTTLMALAVAGVAAGMARMADTTRPPVALEN
jgi:hypothetical protein